MNLGRERRTILIEPIEDPREQQEEEPLPEEREAPSPTAPDPAATLPEA